MDRRDVSVALALALLAAAAYAAFGAGAHPIQDHHGRLAAAFLEGRWWLAEAPPWLVDLVSCGEGRACAVFPPLPAVLAAPLVPLVGEPFGQALVAQVLGGASAGLLYLAVRALGAPRPVAFAGAVLSAFGTTLFFSSVDARAPYVGH
ncbi:MAG TPA: hypothetical protein VMJ92_01365, partial [Candidatus Limnocylindrales bacterium]|nr:hypothetical protein [Candidatus Limnocylindrales bacterium]